MANFKIKTDEDRSAEIKGIKGCIFGKAGIGKTSLLKTLALEKLLFIDMEAGDLSVVGVKVDSYTPRTWPECRDLAVLIGGGNPANSNSQPYSSGHYLRVTRDIGDAKMLEKIKAYNTFFIDSITEAGRICFNWCKNQPQALSEKTGKIDTRGVYGAYGQEMIAWLKQLQHARTKNIWLVGILDEKVDEYNRTVLSPQIEGTKTGAELPGIVDEVLVMANVSNDPKKFIRGFVCGVGHSYGGEIAKDRSGCLETVEPAHLGKLMDKINKNQKINTKIVEV